MLFLVQHHVPKLKKSRRGRKAIYPFAELVRPGMAMTVMAKELEDRAGEAAKKWAQRHPGWSFDYGRDEEDRLVIIRRT